MTANIWHCHKCQGIDLKCILCKEKDKEIRGLKQSITELEKHLQTVNVALKDSTLEIMQIKEKLANEKRIRTILEKDIEEMMSSSSSEDSGSEGGVSTDSESKKERKNRGKRPSHQTHKSYNQKNSKSDYKQKDAKNRKESSSEESDSGHDHSQTRSKKKQKKKQDTVEEESVHHSAAVKFLEKYANKPLENTGDDSFAMKEEKKDERKNKICYEFINKGACTKTGCQFMYFNPNASFPNYPNRRRNMGQKKPENVEHSRKICYNFKNKGFCKYGNTCKFHHKRRDYRSDRRNQNKRDNFNSERRNDKRNGPHYNNEKKFLEEIRSMMGGIRDMINTQKQVLQNHMQAQNLVHQNHQNHPYPPVSVVGQGQQFLPMGVPGTMY